MSELAISSTKWLVISLRNGAGIVFNLNDTKQWQYLQPDVANDQSQQKTNDDDDENTSDLNRNLVKFTPDGQKLVINGQNKQIYIYIPSDDKKTYWQLQRIITVIKRASALDLTNDFLLIADKSGDVYQTDLSTTNNVTLTGENCLMGHLSMLLDVAFVRTNDEQEYILTADRDEKIRLSHYPNAYNIEGYCLGHTEFVSHVKLIDSNRILSASGDGTLRLWHLPDCIQLNVFDSQTLTSSAKQIFYGQSSSSDYQSSSSINHSIWKMDVASASDVFLAFSIYADRAHSIYLTTLTNLEKTSNEQRKLTFNSTYGTIIDYCFSSNDLYILFDSHNLLTVNIPSVLSCDKSEYVQDNDSSISAILATKGFHLMNNINSLEVIFKQLFKTRGDPGDSSYHKRKNQRLEEQEEKRRKKQEKQSTTDENI
ncbi:unnamed protein product [Adineta ricciae]|uniref:tRNA (guanine-N(7)-)-methyltransferase non-catalytic subunit n=1 Tax=Adineta ricciae TaxID=249248 RepID=A0A815F2M5_ADIRI|nr:unnamed protein product [Adineta ricciae]CAF1320421.1 unnamed protein product [Adineta ricciae]